MNQAGAQPFSLATTPNMIGDLLGGSYHFTTFKNPSGMVGGPDGSLSIAGGDRREKISEDCSPLPTDRVFFDFNDFASAALTSDGHIIPVNRYTLAGGRRRSSMANARWRFVHRSIAD